MLCLLLPRTQKSLKLSNPIAKIRAIVFYIDMRFARLMFLFLTTVLFGGLVAFAAWSHQNKEIFATGEAAKVWRPLVSPWKSNPGVVAYYSFQDEKLECGQLRNRISLFPTSREDFKFFKEPIPCRMVQGRWPGKQAIELDRVPLRLPKNYVTGSKFAVSAWIRHAGLGIIQGGNAENVATIMALSDGVRSGWRIDLLFPSNRLTFQLARGKNDSAVGVVSSIRIPPKTWVHIAVTRNEDKIQIFVGGLLAGESEYMIPPATFTAENSLKIGYAGNGFSSAILQVDELTIFTDPPTLEHILFEAVQLPDNTFEHSDLLKIASESFIGRDYNKALSLFTDLCERCSTEKQVYSTLMYRIAEIYQLQNEGEQAKALVMSLAAQPDVNTTIRSFALHDLLCLQEGVNADTDLFITRFPKSPFLDYGVLQAASECYENAMLEFDYALPIK
jgi:hypothetical protein